MKKLNFALLLAFSLSAVLVSCGGGGGGGGGAAPATTSETTNTASTPATTTTTTTTTTSTTTSTPTYFGTKSPTDPKAVNDIVFSDGSATPYTSGLTLTDAQKNAAVAMIFYKGTECSNDGSTRTLGVGLKRSGHEMKWCLNTANGYSTDITTIQCIPSESAGAYTFSGYKDGSDNLSQIAAFLANNGSADDTGTAGNYPAFEYAKNYGSTNGCTGAYASGWYLPSIAELYQIYNQRNSIDAVVVLCAFNRFSDSYFLSSSQHTSIDSAVAKLNFGSFSCGYGSKASAACVCAVRAF